VTPSGTDRKRDRLGEARWRAVNAPHVVALLRAVSNRCDNRIMTIARKVVGDD
jgi:hypothetical protein